MAINARFYSQTNLVSKSWTIFAIIFLERKSNQIDKKILRWKKTDNECLRNPVEKIVHYVYLFTIICMHCWKISRQHFLTSKIAIWCLTSSRTKSSDINEYDVYKPRDDVVSYRDRYFSICMSDYNYCFYISSTRLYKEKFIMSIYTCASCTWST